MGGHQLPYWQNSAKCQTSAHTTSKQTNKQTMREKKLRNIIQDCPVLQTFDFEASQKSPTLVL